jgi:iron complex outermembrane receptor protein
LTLGLGSRYIGSTEGDNANSFNVKPYTIWNAVVQYDLGRFSMPGSTLALNVNNLFDKNYVAGCYATTACFYGAERQITATATLRF